MATAQHYVWAGGHFLLLVCASRYLLSWMTFRSSGQSKLYSLSYFGALVSYAIVCYKSFVQGPQPAGSTMRRALTDENVQYFMLALFWWMSKPVPVSLVPFATFSLFHALTFLRSNVLPHFFPPTPSVTAGQPVTQHPFLKKVQGWIKANYDPAMKLVAYAEMLILVRVVLGALTLQNSLLAPIIYAHFLRLRYYQSQFTQRSVAHVSSFIDGFVRKPGNPPIFVVVWEKVQMLVSRWAGNILTQQQPAGPGRR
ncbi:hypothetical protein M0805_008351 [Coniferiporia weirii]|nr:hypothetical protein M0805_008351 [Coniferiporia weirii]